MNRTKDNKVNYAELLGKSSVEITEMVKSGSIPYMDENMSGPIPRAEQENFVKFSSLAPDSEERKALLKELGVDLGTPGEPTGGEPGPEGGEPVGGEGGGEPAGAGDPPPDPNAGDQFLGHGSLEEMKNAHQKLLNDMAALNGEVNKHRASNGRLGVENTRMATELEQMRNRMSELEKSVGDKPALEKPVKPKLPKPSEYDDGVLDQGYQDALERFHSDLDTYETRLEEYNSSKKPEWLTEMETRMNKVEQMATSAHSFAETSLEDTAQRAQNEAWSGVWSEAAQMQNRFGLETTVPLNEINPFAQIDRNPNAVDSDGKRLYSDGQVQAAQEYMSKLPAQDKDRFYKMAKLINVTFDFGSETPTKRYRDVRAAIIDNDLEKEFPLVTKVDPTAGDRADALHNQQMNLDGAASGMSGSDLGGHDSQDGPMSQEEKTARLSELLKMRRTNIREFQNNKELYDEFAGLCNDLGYSLPSAKR